METTKTTEKFQSVHKTFSYTPKSALTNQWSSLAFGIGMVIVPLIYPFGLRIRRAVILSPEVLSTILIICGALLLLMTFFSIRKARVNPEKPDVPLNKNDAFQKVQKRRVQEKR